MMKKYFLRMITSYNRTVKQTLNGILLQCLRLVRKWLHFLEEPNMENQCPWCATRSSNNSTRVSNSEAVLLTGCPSDSLSTKVIGPCVYCSLPITERKRDRVICSQLNATISTAIRTLLSDQVSTYPISVNSPIVLGRQCGIFSLSSPYL